MRMRRRLTCGDSCYLIKPDGTTTIVTVTGVRGSGGYYVQAADGSRKLILTYADGRLERRPQ